MKRLLADEAASSALGACLARALGPPGDSPRGGVQLDLRGPLGAGKSTVVRGLLRELGVTGTVRSPTYTLVEPYEAGGWQVVHYDLYRINDPEELELLGAREHFAAGVLRCVEWPERGRGWLPAADLVLELAHRGSRRDAALTADSEFGRAWLIAMTVKILQ